MSEVEIELSNDARAIAYGHFLMGSRGSITYFAWGGQSRLSDRGRAAFKELEAAGLVTHEEYNHLGKMIIRGTAAMDDWIKSQDHKAMRTFMEKHGHFSTFEMNPDYAPTTNERADQ